MPSMIALVDCNNFFVSCEELFCPRLKGRATVILSSNDGCVVSRSKQAKAMGIAMGQPAFELKREIGSGQLVALSSNFPLYADLSRRVMEVLESFSPEMEVSSIDEAFFVLEGEGLLERAGAMQKKVLQWVGIPVSIGIAKTKTLAKWANQQAKGSGVPVWIEDQADLERVAPEEIWGIGKKLAERLKELGIYTAAQFRDKEDGWLKKALGVTGLRVALELRGVRCFELSQDEEKRQSITCSRSFGRSVGEKEVLEQAIATFVAHAAEKLREQKSKARFLQVFLQSGFPRQTDSMHFVLPLATSYTPDLIALAKSALAKLFRPGTAYKKGGVLLGDFVDEGSLQMDLFAPDPKSGKKEAAMRIVDQINATYDKEAVRFLAEGVGHSWKSSSSNRSPPYTTSWKGLLGIDVG